VYPTAHLVNTVNHGLHELHLTVANPVLVADVKLTIWAWGRVLTLYVRKKHIVNSVGEEQFVQEKNGSCRQCIMRVSTVQCVVNVGCVAYS
jgi:hypothetical protein